MDNEIGNEIIMFLFLNCNLYLSIQNIHHGY